MPGENLDLTSGEEQPCGSRGTAAAKRPFVGVHFRCCDVYTRVYINRDLTAYVGYCPRCSRKVELKIGPEGTDARLFEAF